MNIREYQAESILAADSVPLPKGGIVYTTAAAVHIDRELCKGVKL